MKLSKLLFIWIIATNIALAVPKSLPVPRFVTIKFNEVNARKGPSKDFPIDWVFVSAKEPVEIIEEYGQWRKIRDIQDEGGWVHSSGLSGKRSVIIIAKEKISLLSSPKESASLLAYLEPQLRCELIKQEKDWCKISCNNYKGWVQSEYLWGIYK